MACTAGSTQIRIDSEQLRTACQSCSLRTLCVPGSIGSEDLERLDGMVGSRRQLRRGEPAFQLGEPFQSLYAVRSGSMKSLLTAGDGRHQVTGFQLQGELLGLDGMATHVHGVSAVALEDTTLCVLPFDDLENIAESFYPLQRQLNRVMSREITREQSMMLLLGRMRAHERVAAFLVNLSLRYEALGYSPNRFMLRMTRDEIGSYLGLKLETVSRGFSRLQDEGLVSVSGKEIELLDFMALRKTTGTCDEMGDC